VLDSDPPRQPAHHSLLSDALQRSSDEWELVGRFPQRRGQNRRTGDIYLYRLRNHESKKPERVPRQLAGGDL
jgi:hypothetical protein